MNDYLVAFINNHTEVKKQNRYLLNKIQLLYSLHVNL